MGLAKYLKSGVDIVGLIDTSGGSPRSLLNAGGMEGGDFGEVSKDIIRGSYDVDSRFFGRTTITFRSDRSGRYPVTLLPYYAGSINTCTVEGDEVVSGPFTGCWFSLYLDWGGTLKAGHIDTAKNGKGEKPSEARWRKLDRNIVAESKTAIDDQLMNAIRKTGEGANAGYMLGVATPNPPSIVFFNVIKQGAGTLRVIGQHRS